MEKLGIITSADNTKVLIDFLNINGIIENIPLNVLEHFSVGEIVKFDEEKSRVRKLSESQDLKKLIDLGEIGASELRQITTLIKIYTKNKADLFFGANFFEEVSSMIKDGVELDDNIIQELEGHQTDRINYEKYTNIIKTLKRKYFLNLGIVINKEEVQNKKFKLELLLIDEEEVDNLTIITDSEEYNEEQVLYVDKTKKQIIATYLSSYTKLDLENILILKKYLKNRLSENESLQENVKQQMGNPNYEDTSEELGLLGIVEAESRQYSKMFQTIK